MNNFHIIEWRRKCLEKALWFQYDADDKIQKISELEEMVITNTEEIERLKLEFENAIKRADAAHTREQNAQEVIENMRLNVKQLNQEIEQKNRQLASGEEWVPFWN